MERYSWTATIQLNLTVFKLVGLWPRGNGYEINFYLLHAFATTFIFGFILSFGQVWKLLTNLNDIEVVAGTAFLSISTSLVVVKMFSMGLSIRVFKQLVKNLEIDLFQPRNSGQIKLVAPDLKLWKTMYNLLAGCGTVTISFWAMVPILTNTTKQHRLPFIVWYPYNTTISPLYEITYIHQVLSILFIAFLNTNLDTFVAAFNLFAGAQLDILCDELRSLQGNDFGRKFTICVKHHQKIISFVKAYNEAFDWIIFAQFFASAISVGLTMFLLTIVAPFSSEFCSFLFYGAGIVMEIFFYCWFGNELLYKSSQVFLAAYESNWIEASLEDKFDVIFFMIRTQNPLKVSTLGLFDLSLENFLKILKTGYSYFALVSRLSSKE